MTHEISTEQKYDILYLQNEDQLAILHCQEFADNRAEAIELARKSLGNTAYFISVEMHKMDMNWVHVETSE